MESLKILGQVHTIEVVDEISRSDLLNGMIDHDSQIIYIRKSLPEAKKKRSVATRSYTRHIRGSRHGLKRKSRTDACTLAVRLPDYQSDYFFLDGLCERAEPAAVLDDLLVRPSLNTLDAAEAARLEVTFDFDTL